MWAMEKEYSGLNVNEEENNIESFLTGSPGFPGPPKYKKQVVPLRRSPRLSLKGDGSYQSPEEKARLLKKPGTLSIRRASKKRKGNEKEIQMEYLKSRDPLSFSQAEVVVLAAGVEMEKDLEMKVKGVLAI